MTTEAQKETPAITLKGIVAYCEFENKMQKQVYPKRIENKKMTKEKANENYFIITQLKALAVDALNRGLTWEQVRGIIQQYPMQTGQTELL